MGTAAIAAGSDSRFERDDAFRAWLTETLIGADDPDTVLRTVLEALGRHLGVSRTGYAEVADDGAALVVPWDWSASPQSFVGRHALRKSDWHVRRYLAGETVAYPDWRALPMAEEERRDLAAGDIATVAVPLMRAGRWEALVSVMDDHPREWSGDEVALISHVARLCHNTLAHARALRAMQESEAQFRMLAEEMPGICWLGGPDGQGYWMNRAGHDFLGPTMLPADNMARFLHPDQLATVAAGWTEALANGTPAEFMIDLLGADGRYHPMLSRAQPIRDADGRVIRWCGLITDLTAERARADRDDFLRRHAEQTRDTLDAASILATTAEMLGEHLGASRVAFSETDPEDRDLYLVTSDWTDGVAPSVTGDFRMADVFPALHAAYRAGRTIVATDNYDVPMLDSAQAARLAAVGIRSGINVPLVKDGVLVAVLVAQQAVPRVWSDDEVRLAEEVAERTWATLSRARAERELRARERNQAFLLDWSDHVRNETSPAAILGETLRRVRTHLAAAHASYADCDAECRVFTVRAEARDDTRSTIGRTIAIDTLDPAVAQEWVAGEVVRYDDVARDPRTTPALAKGYAAAEIGAFISFPMVAGGQVRGILSLHHRRPHRWRVEEIQLVRDVAARLWIMLERARAEQALLERERAQSMLLAWSDEVRNDARPRSILAKTLRSIGEHLAVSRVNFGEADITGDALVVEDEWVDGVPSVKGARFPFAALGAEVLAQHVEGAAFISGDTHSDPRFDPATLAMYDSVGARAIVSIPLIRRGRLIAVLSAQQSVPRQWTEGEIRLLADIADRTWAILERARSEERLAESEALLAGYLENAPIAMYLKHADGRYLRMNQQMARVLGVGIDEALGKTAFDVVPDHIARQVTILDQQALDGDTQEAELDFGDREEFASLLSIRFPITVREGGETRIGGFTLDLTDRKRAEAALARSREALFQSEKLTALGSLLAGVSHELNNPLSIVVAQAVMMERQAGDGALADRAYKIRKAADRCARIVQTFLAMARQKEPQREPTDLNAVVTAALELTGYGLRTDGVEVEQDLSATLPLVPADADQLHQIVINLILNAQQAMVEAGVPERRLRVQTAVGDDPATVALYVADSGPGVPDELRRRVFEPFFTTKAQGQGTGVGLSFSQGLAEAHGGRLTLLPDDGCGAAFRLTLPVDAARTLPPAEEVAIDRRTPPRRALIVDDEREIAESLADFLAIEGFDCVIADDGAAAQAMLSEAGYDLIVSDLRMPGIDGPALHAWIAANRPEMAPRMAFATGDTLGAAAARFIAEAQRPVLEKPFMPDGVRRLLKQMELA